MQNTDTARALAFLHSLIDDRELARFSHSDIRVLCHLALSTEGLSFGQIVVMAHVPQSSLGRALDRLWDMGIITETEAVGDKRFTIVRLKKRGVFITDRVAQLYRNPIGDTEWLKQLS